MSNLSQPRQSAATFFPAWLNSMMAVGVATLVAGSVAKPALADPPVIVNLPQVFCFRITDIQAIPDPEDNKFAVQFEVLNWTNLPATDVDIALTTESDVQFAGANVQPNLTPPSGNQNHPSDWTVNNTLSTNSLILWEAGLGNPSTTPTTYGPIPNIDLIGITQQQGSAQGAINFINANYDFDPDFDPNNDPETIDNGPNVLDGFVMEVDDWDVGEFLSFNWFLTATGNGYGTESGVNNVGGGTHFPIGTSNGGNAFGFGVLNIARVEPGTGDLPGGLFNGNTGFNQSSSTFVPGAFQGTFVQPSTLSRNTAAQSGGFEFAAEFGAGQTAPFQNPADAAVICGPNGCPPNTQPKTPEPSNLLALGLAGLGMLGYKKRRRS